MSAVDDRFEQLRSAGKKAFVAFVTAGDPSLEFTKKLIKQVANSGASIIEVGFPYSDPIADGPVIQASYQRALESGITTDAIFAAVGEVAGEVDAPLVAMISYAIIHRIGVVEFIARAKQAGFSGAIVPDLLVEESGEFQKACAEQDFSLIQLVTPTTPRERAKKIAEASSGFLYYVSVAGITGERKELPPDLADNVTWLRTQTNVPICIGFGISRPEHVAQLSPVADGVIVGSAIVRRVTETQEESAILESVGRLVSQLQGAV